MKEDKNVLPQCPECTYPEPSRANCKACFDQKYENGEITDDDIREFGALFIENINKELGIEDEYRFTEYEEAKTSQSSTPTLKLEED